MWTFSGVGDRPGMHVHIIRHVSGRPCDFLSSPRKGGVRVAAGEVIISRVTPSISGSRGHREVWRPWRGCSFSFPYPAHGVRALGTGCKLRGLSR